MQNIIMLSVSYAQCLNVTCKPCMLNVVILSVVMLNVVMLSVVLLSVVMLSVIMLNVIILSVIVLSVIMLSIIMLSVIMLNVAVPFNDDIPLFQHKHDELWCGEHDGTFFHELFRTSGSSLEQEPGMDQFVFIFNGKIGRTNGDTTFFYKYLT